MKRDQIVTNEFMNYTQNKFLITDFIFFNEICFI